MAEDKKEYIYEKKSGWQVFSEEQLSNVFDFCEDYKSFLSDVKTEREAILKIQEESKDKNCRLFLNKHSSAALVVPGEKPLSEGVRLVVSHVDSPRLDLKQVPLFEDSDSNLALFETHYYGGIKNFHWLTIPLAFHGVIVKQNGDKIMFKLGEDDNDPVFSVPDILPHLSYEVQDSKKLEDAIKGETLDVMVGSKPITKREDDDEDSKDKIKTAILKKLYEDYGLIEEDFVSADLEVVPAYKPRDMGFDRSLIGAYGQDDRACVFTSMRALFEVENPTYTAIALFVDKEEIGSEGNTSAQVVSFLRSIFRELDPMVDPDKVMLNSKAISADVDAAVTPNYTEVFELKNSASLGRGVAMAKFTGHGGKYNANDAPAEYVAEIRRILNENKIPWQTGELGKVDYGGGGTVGKYFSRLGMSVIDLGPPVLNMHSPFEVTSKIDVYAAYLAYKMFFMG